MGMHEDNMELLVEEAKRILRQEAGLLEDMKAAPNVVSTDPKESETFTQEDLPKNLEVRPRKKIDRGLLNDLLESDPRILKSWLERGYDDALWTLRRVKEPLAAKHELVRSEIAVAESEAALAWAELRRQATMSRMKAYKGRNARTNDG